MAKGPKTVAEPEMMAGRINEQAARVGSRGLNQTGGWIAEETQPELRGLRGARTFRNMADNSTTVGALLFAITMLLRNASWSLQSVDETVEAEDAKRIAEEALGDMTTSWADIVDEITTMFVYGYAPMEVIWKRREGPDADALKTSRYTDRLIAPAAIELRNQLTVSRWIYANDQQTVIGLEQQPPNGGALTIPRERLALFRTTKQLDNPEGRSLLRTSVRAFNIVTKMENIEAIGVERDLAGYPVVYVPPKLFESNASPTDKAELAAYIQLVQKIRRDQSEGIALPNTRDRHGNRLYELTLLSTGGSRAIPTPAIIDRWHRHIATAVLADFLFLGQQAVGSFALSSDKTALFASAVGGFGRGIADTFNTEILRPMWVINGLEPALMPTLKMGDLETADMASISALITAMASAGAPMFPDRELENHLRRNAGLPEAPEDGGDMADAPGRPPDAGDEETAGAQ